MRQKIISILAIIMMLTASCVNNHQKTVAVSQCSMDEWRDQMNEEMRREAFLHPELNVEFHSTADNTEAQIREIESFIERKVDLIVVAPNEEEALRPSIERAHNAGIPVVLIDRRANTNKYTAYVGGDNVEVGRQAAKYLLSRLPNGGNIIEIQGLTSSSSSQERRLGFHEIIDQHPEINIIADFAADWQRQKSRYIMDTVSKRLKDTKIDAIFAYNDRMAIGAHDILNPNGKDTTTIFIGVDALMNDTIGVGRVEDGTLTASLLYPTGGDKAIRTAACILNGQSYEREQILKTCIVNLSNVHLMRLQGQHIAEQDSKIEFLNEKLDKYFKQYSAQRTLLITFIILVIVGCAFLAFVIRAYQTKHRLNLKLEEQAKVLRYQRDELAEQKETVERQRDLLEAERDKLIEASMEKYLPSEPEKNDAAMQQNRDDDPFMKKLYQIIGKHLDNSELTVDMIAAEVNLGRVQLYRKCKASSGLSPNELLRSARLNKAYKMLQETDLNVSEVAYSVGFSSPSYFAKCYKEQFGKNPTDDHKR